MFVGTVVGGLRLSGKKTLFFCGKDGNVNKNDDNDVGRNSKDAHKHRDQRRYGNNIVPLGE